MGSGHAHCPCSQCIRYGPVPSECEFICKDFCLNRTDALQVSILFLKPVLIGILPCLAIWAWVMPLALKRNWHFVQGNQKFNRRHSVQLQRDLPNGVSPNGCNASPPLTSTAGTRCSRHGP